MKYLALILSNLKRHKLRTALTMLSILVAFLLFGYLSAIRTAFTAGIDVADLDRLIVRLVREELAQLSQPVVHQQPAQDQSPLAISPLQ